MKLTYWLIIFSFLLGTPLAAQEPAAPDSAISLHDRLGPVVNGRHRQPTKAEIERRERASGESAASIEGRDRRKDKQVDDLYKELNPTEQGVEAPNTH
jgi:hypothetical protein